MLTKLKAAAVALLALTGLSAGMAKAETLPCDTQGWLAAEKSLVITDLSVVNDSRAKKNGAWSFARMMAAAHPAIAATKLGDAAHSWLDQFGTIASLNGFKVDERTPGAMLGNWPRVGVPQGNIGSGTNLDVTRAPLRLLAIVYRLDLNEGRFVFGATDPQTGIKDFAVIFEFQLPAGATPGFWPESFAALSSSPFGPAYNKRLETLTDLFTKPDSGTTLLKTVRTNEQYFGQGWDLREFRVNAAGTALVLGTPEKTPDVSLNGANGAKLVDWVKAHGEAIKSGDYAIPAEFQGGSAFLEDDHFKWLKSAQGVEPAVRAAFAMGTCNGCHGRETDTRFLHIAPRLAIEPAKLSKFLVDEMKIRASQLTKKVCLAAAP